MYITKRNTILYGEKESKNNRRGVEWLEES